MTTLEECLQRKGIHFTGICVQDAQRNDLVKEIGVTLGWILDYNKAMKFSKILVSGNDKTGIEHRMTNCGVNWHRKERRKFFIADIRKIVHLNTLLRETNGKADDRIRQHHCGANFPLKPPYWDERRYAIYFTNPTETFFCNENYQLWQTSVKYIL